MANIQKVTERHQWREQRIPQLKKEGLLEDDPNRMKLMCFNCRMPHDPADGPPPVTGCYRETKFPMQGKEAQQEAYRQEERKRRAEIDAERRHEAAADQKMQAFLEYLASRRR